jgi:hypothetical protein
MREVLTTHMRSKLAMRVRSMAKDEEMSVSQCLEWLVERALRRMKRDENVPTYTHADIERDLEEVDKHPERCITYNSPEEFFKDFDERTAKID